MSRGRHNENSLLLTHHPLGEGKKTFFKKKKGSKKQLCILQLNINIKTLFANYAVECVLASALFSLAMAILSRGFFSFLSINFRKKRNQEIWHTSTHPRKKKLGYLYMKLAGNQVITGSQDLLRIGNVMRLIIQPCVIILELGVKVKESNHPITVSTWRYFVVVVFFLDQHFWARCQSPRIHHSDCDTGFQL